MEENLLTRLYKIIDELPSENSTIDYKEKPYDLKMNIDELLKDVCGFLNCIMSYGKDKFIIFGVQETKNKEGISTYSRKGIICGMDDDNEYQKRFEKIYPIPLIETGTFEKDEKTYGYIYISKDNTNRVYCVNDEINNIYKKSKNEEEMIKYIPKSSAVIRRGSRNDYLTEAERREIYEHDRKVNSINYTSLLSAADFEVTKKDDDILKICSLFGTWHENNEKEKEILSKIIGKEYNEWIQVIRNLKKKKSEMVSYKNDTWKIENKEQVIKKYAEDFYIQDLKSFFKCAEEILKEEHARFNYKTSRNNSVYSINNTFSQEMKQSILESIAYMKSISNDFVNCESQLKKLLPHLVNNILDDATWKLVASLNELFPLIAEIDGRNYLYQVNQIIKKSTITKKLAKGKSNYLFAYNYISGLRNGLNILSWDENYLGEVFDTYCEIYKYDKDVINDMTRILLPWHPQTNAGFEMKIQAVQNTLEQNEELGWKLLMNLMPSVTNDSMEHIKPRWNDIVEEITVKRMDAIKEYEQYVLLAVENVNDDPNRLCSLVEICQYVTEKSFDAIYDKVISYEDNTLNDEEKYIIWDECDNVINHINKYNKEDETIIKDKIDKIKQMAEIIKPKSKMIYYRKRFNNDYWHLFDLNLSFDETNNKILTLQEEAIRDIYDNIENVIEFSKNVKDAKAVGVALAKLQLIKTDEKIVLKLLNEEDCDLARGYVREKIDLEKFDWLNSLNKNLLKIDGKINLLTQLPEQAETWELVDKWLGRNNKKYWEQADIRVIKDNSSYDYAIEKLLEVKRPITAIELINMAIYDKKTFNRELSIEALNQCLLNKDEINQNNIYEIKRLLIDLQRSNCSKVKLYDLEWGYMSLVRNQDDYKPITVIKKVNKDPKLFNKILEMIYNDDEEKNMDLFTKARIFFDLWDVVPGYDEESKTIDLDFLNNWFNKAVEISEKKNIKEGALNMIGQVLYFAPKDKSGFWIDKGVAKLLNKKDNESLRRGFSIKAFNSLGVVNIDPEATAWRNQEKIWRDRAEETKLKYMTFANTLRELADDYARLAEEEIDNY